MAVQKPFGPVFLRMTRRERTLPSYEAFDADQHMWQPLQRVEYDIFPCFFAHEHSLPIDEDADVHILRGLRFDGIVVFTNHLPEPVELFVRRHPSVDAHRAASRHGRMLPIGPRDDRDRLRKEFQWLTEKDLDHASGFKRLDSASNQRAVDVVLGDEVGSDSAGEDAEGDPIEVDENLVREELAGLRAEYEEGAF